MVWDLKDSKQTTGKYKPVIRITVGYNMTADIRLKAVSEAQDFQER